MNAVHSRFWSSDGPPFHHLRHDGLKIYDSLWLAGVSHTPTCWDVGSSRLRAVPDLPLQKPRLHRRLAQVLCLHKEALVLAPIGEGVPSVGSGPPSDLNDKTPVLRSEPTLGSNPTMSNVHIVPYSLFYIFR